MPKKAEAKVGSATTKKTVAAKAEKKETKEKKTSKKATVLKKDVTTTKEVFVKKETTSKKAATSKKVASTSKKEVDLDKEVSKDKIVKEKSAAKKIEKTTPKKDSDKVEIKTTNEEGGTTKKSQDYKEKAAEIENNILQKINANPAMANGKFKKLVSVNKLMETGTHIGLISKK